MAAINRAFDAEEDLTESNNQQNVPGSLPTRQDQLCRVDVEAIDESLARKQPQIFAALPGISIFLFYSVMISSRRGAV